MLLVLDTSVILKWFTQENYSGVAVNIREDFYSGIHEIVEPDLLVYEFTNVLRYNPNYTTEDVVKAVDSLIEMGLDIVVPTAEVLKGAVTLAKKYDITVYDAVFVSLAKLIDATIITADEKLYGKVKELKFVKFISETG